MRPVSILEKYDWGDFNMTSNQMHPLKSMDEGPYSPVELSYSPGSGVFEYTNIPLITYHAKHGPFQLFGIRSTPAH